MIFRRVFRRRHWTEQLRVDRGQVLAVERDRPGVASGHLKRPGFDAFRDGDDNGGRRLTRDAADRFR
jgi:hypothetical protein